MPIKINVVTNISPEHGNFVSSINVFYLGWYETGTGVLKWCKLIIFNDREKPPVLFANVVTS